MYSMNDHSNSSTKPRVRIFWHLSALALVAMECKPPTGPDDSPEAGEAHSSDWGLILSTPVTLEQFL